jgi:hypothetical protein
MKVLMLCFPPKCLRQPFLEGFALGCPIADRGIFLPLPLVGKVNDQAGMRRGASHGEGIVKDGALLISLARFA